VSTDEFRLDVEPEPEPARVRPSGELDLATVDRVERALRELRDAGVRDVVLDLRGLTFMDSTGLSLTLRWTVAAEQDGLSFSLIPGAAPIQRVFELAGIAGRLPFRPPAG
jgi:anti-sigma B factor antagonist